MQNPAATSKELEAATGTQEIASRVQRAVDKLKNRVPVPLLLAVACWQAWTSHISATAFAVQAPMFSNMAYSVAFGCAAILLPLLRLRFSLSFGGQRLPLIAGLCCLVGFLADLFPVQILGALGSALMGVGSALFLMATAFRLARITPYRATALFLGSAIISHAINRTLAVLSPPGSTIVYCAVLLISTALFSLAEAYALPQVENPVAQSKMSREASRGFLRLFLSFFFYAFATNFITHLVMHNMPRGVASDLSAYASLIVIAFSLLCLVLIAAQDDSNVGMLLYAFMLALIAVTLVQEALTSIPAFLPCLSVGLTSFIFVLFNVLMARIALQSPETRRYTFAIMGFVTGAIVLSVVADELLFGLAIGSHEVPKIAVVLVCLALLAFLLVVAPPARIMESLSLSFGEAAPLKMVVDEHTGLWKAAVRQLSDEGSLTPREAEVLLLLARGKKVKSIADQLVISEHTVRAHVRGVYRKLDVHSQDELLKAVEERRFVLSGGTHTSYNQ